jgi:hypothetical protein
MHADKRALPKRMLMRSLAYFIGGLMATMIADSSAAFVMKQPADYVHVNHACTRQQARARSFGYGP